MLNISLITKNVIKVALLESLNRGIMEVIEFKIPYSGRNAEFRFYPIGDIHYGAIECAEDEVAQTMNKCLNDPYAYVLGKGDYADCITKNDPRFDTRNLAPWVTKDNILESQREKVNELFRPIAKEKRLIGLLVGNHEEEIHMRHDNDFGRNICRDLDVNYGGYQCYVVLKFEQKGNEGHHQVFIWHAWHGAGSAQTEGARLMRLMRLVHDIEANMYTMGHLHGAITTHTPDRLFYNLKSRKIESVKVIASLSGSWLKGFEQSTERRPLNPHYGEKKGYKPARIGCPVIKIRPFYREMEIEV